MATRYLRQLNERMIKDSEEALSVARELVRDKVLPPQSLADYTQILEYLRYADRNIVQADTAAKPLPTVEIDRPMLSPIADQGELNAETAWPFQDHRCRSYGERLFAYYQERKL